MNRYHDRVPVGPGARWMLLVLRVGGILELSGGPVDFLNSPRQLLADCEGLAVDIGLSVYGSPCTRSAFTGSPRLVGLFLPPPLGSPDGETSNHDSHRDREEERTWPGQGVKGTVSFGGRVNGRFGLSRRSGRGQGPQHSVLR